MGDIVDAVFMEEGTGGEGTTDSKGFRSGLKSASLIFDIIAITNMAVFAFQMFNIWVDTVDPFDLMFVITREFITDGIKTFREAMVEMLGKETVDGFDDPNVLPSPIFLLPNYEKCYGSDWRGDPRPSCPIDYSDYYNGYKKKYEKEYRDKDIRDNRFLFNILYK